MWKILLLVFISVVSAAYYEELVERVHPELKKHNAKWTAGHNKRFAGQTKEQLTRMLGAKLDKVNAPKIYPQIADASAIPDTFDARSNWPQCSSINFIRDQACCGSCWAVSSAGAMSDRHCIDSNGAVQVYISDEDIMSCCSACGSGCEGGWPVSAFQYWQQTGVVTGGPYDSNQGCQPYQIPSGCGGEAPTPACSSQCLAGYGSTFTNDKHYGASYYQVGNGVSGMQQEMYTNGPVVSCFTVYEDFYSYTSGVYHHVTGDVLGGHAVRVLGWGTEDNTPYWLVANSWNQTWGEQGLFKILRGDNECGFESNIAAGQARN